MHYQIIIFIFFISFLPLQNCMYKYKVRIQPIQDQRIHRTIHKSGDSRETDLFLTDFRYLKKDLLKSILDLFPIGFKPIY